MNVFKRVAAGLGALAAAVGAVLLVASSRTAMIVFAALVVLGVAYMIGDVLLGPVNRDRER